VTSTNFVVVDTTNDRNEVIGEVDYSWAFTTIHEGAIYMLQSEQFHVDRLDWERRKAFVRRVDSEYYTDAETYAKVKILQVLRTAPPDAAGGEGPRTEYGEVEVVRKATGYKKIKFYTQENLGWGPILLPEDTYHTQAAWVTVPRGLVEELGLPTSEVVDGLNGVANLLHGIASFLLMCDGRDLGVVVGDRAREWFSAPSRRGGPGGGAPEAPPDRFEPTVFLYDHYSGGIGLAEALHPRFPELLRGARERLAACPCPDGCPSCVGPAQEVGPSAKETASRILESLLARASAPAPA
jgi:DEAD/DEAH box helicase domain-containing protein